MTNLFQEPIYPGLRKLWSQFHRPFSPHFHEAEKRYKNIRNCFTNIFHIKIGCVLYLVINYVKFENCNQDKTSKDKGGFFSETIRVSKLLNNINVGKTF